MSIGTYISGTGHAALIVWLIAGWGMHAEPLDFEVTEVSVVSGEAFEAMMRAGQPDAPAAEIVAPTPPEIEEAPTPPAPVEETPPEPVAPPAPVEEPVAETPPEAPDLTPPPTEVTDSVPDLPDIPDVVAPPPSAELGSSLRPQPRPADRVAPEPIAPPPPDTEVAEQVSEATNDAPTEEVAEEPVEDTTAPEEAVTEIVTEAEEPAFAPEVSLRPQTRPNRPAPQPASETPAETATQDDAVAAAIAAAQESETPPQPTQGVSGGDLSDADKNSFLRQIGNCWNVGSASTGALSTRVTVGFSMTQEGLVDTNSIRLIGHEGGTAADADVAFRIARSALVRCQNDGGRTGYDLPADQYDVWRNVELTFNPDRMRNR